jgi:hypothetical protein
MHRLETTMTSAREPARQGEASPTSQQELYGRRAPKDLDEGPGVGRNADDMDEADAEPGRGEDATGRPGTARSGANTQT